MGMQLRIERDKLPKYSRVIINAGCGLATSPYLMATKIHRIERMWDGTMVLQDVGASAWGSNPSTDVAGLKLGGKERPTMLGTGSAD